jgi:hypothetical protein
MRIALIGISAAAILLGGCVSLQEQANETASARQIVCIDGVEYIAIPLKSSWAMAPHYKPDGTLYTCTNSVPKVG